jgi:hypothetical protein
VARSLLAKFHQIPKFQEFPVKFYLCSTHRNFSEFYFKFHFESREIPIRKVDPYSKFFPTIFYFKNLELGKYLLNQPKFGGIQILFEPFEYF